MRVMSGFSICSKACRSNVFNLQAQDYLGKEGSAGLLAYFFFMSLKSTNVISGLPLILGVLCFILIDFTDSVAIFSFYDVCTNLPILLEVGEIKNVLSQTTVVLMRAIKEVMLPLLLLISLFLYIGKRVLISRLSNTFLNS